MTYNPNPRSMTWNDTLADLRETFDKWGVKNWEWKCPISDNWAGRGSNHWSWAVGRPDQIGVTIVFKHKTQGERSITVSKFFVPANNIRALWLALEALRMNEQRGLDNVAREFYTALPAPATERDPWEVLGIRSDAAPEVIKAAYNALANKHHPDKGGTSQEMAEINKAYAKVKD